MLFLEQHAIKVKLTPSIISFGFFKTFKEPPRFLKLRNIFC